MKPIVLMKATSSLRRELIIVIAVLIVVCLLPVAALFSIAHTSLLSLADSAIDDLYQGAVSNTDTYDWGNCTYWAALLRQQAGDPIPNGWGNASQWAKNAEAAGYLVNHVPSVGSIMQIATVDNGLGHVAYVEAVASDGSWTISEMNVKGFDIVDTRTYPPNTDSSFYFIHDSIQ
jgi:surface antigen